MEKSQWKQLQQKYQVKMPKTEKATTVAPIKEKETIKVAKTKMSKIKKGRNKKKVKLNY